MLIGAREKKNARDQIGDIAEASGLAAIAIDGEIFIEQRLDHQVGDDAPVGWLQTRPVGVKDAHHARIHAVIAVVGHDESLGESLGLIVDRTWPYRVDVAPIAFLLGVNIGVAVALGGGGMEEAGLIFTRQVQSIPGPHGADIQRFRTEARIISGAGGRREVEDIIDWARIERLADVLLDQVESSFVAQTGQVGGASGGKIVHAHHLMTLANQCVAQMRAEEAGGAGDQDTLHRQDTGSP